MQYSGTNNEWADFWFEVDKGKVCGFSFNWPDGSVYSDGDGNLWIGYISFKEPRRLEKEECAELLLIEFPRIAMECGVPEDVREIVFTFLHERVISGKNDDKSCCKG